MNDLPGTQKLAVQPAVAANRPAPLPLVDSQQMRLARVYPGANYRPTTATVQVIASGAVGAGGAGVSAMGRAV